MFTGKEIIQNPQFLHKSIKARKISRTKGTNIPGFITEIYKTSQITDPIIHITVRMLRNDSVIMTT